MVVQNILSIWFILSIAYAVSLLPKYNRQYIYRSDWDCVYILYI